MPLWIAIMIAGATGCGFLFLKAREIEKAAPYKKLKQESLTLRKAARRAAARPSEVVEEYPDYSHDPVSMSKDLPSNIVEQITEIIKSKEVK